MVGFVDWYSGWAEAFPVPDKSAETIAHLLLEEIIPRHSTPLQLVTDNGTVWWYVSYPRTATRYAPVMVLFTAT